MLQNPVIAFRAQRENVCGRIYQDGGCSISRGLTGALVGASQRPSNSPPLNERQPAGEDVSRRCPFTDEIARLRVESPAAVAIEKAFGYFIVILGLPPTGPRTGDFSEPSELFWLRTKNKNPRSSRIVPKMGREYNFAYGEPDARI